jgi:hypothetical protein
MENKEVTSEQQRQMDAHRIQSRRCMALVVEELGGNDERAVTTDLMSYMVRVSESPEGWRDAASLLAEKFPGLVLRERFRALPYWAVRRFVVDEYELRFVAAYMRPRVYAGAEPDNPENLSVLATVNAWLEADGNTHPEIHRYLKLDEEELKVLIQRSQMLLPSKLEAAAYDAGWIGGRAWQSGRGWSQPWLNRLAEEGHLAHFYAWLKDRLKQAMRVL